MAGKSRDEPRKVCERQKPKHKSPIPVVTPEERARIMQAMKDHHWPTTEDTSRRDEEILKLLKRGQIPSPSVTYYDANGITFIAGVVVGLVIGIIIGVLM